MEVNRLYKTFPSLIFLKLALIYWLVLSIFLLLFDAGDALMYLNKHSNFVFDFVFGNITYTGHGIFVLIVSCAFLFKKINDALYLGSTFLFVAIFTNVLKKLVFMQNYRPLWYYEYIDFHRMIDNIAINYMGSFPSGHAMAAFGLATTLSVIYNKKKLSVLLFVYATLVSFSRIYLCQHFLIDIYWGAVLGIISAVLGNYFVNVLSGLFKNGFTTYPIQYHIKRVFSN